MFRCSIAAANMSINFSLNLNSTLMSCGIVWMIKKITKKGGPHLNIRLGAPESLVTPLSVFTGRVLKPWTLAVSMARVNRPSEANTWKIQDRNSSNCRTTGTQWTGESELYPKSGSCWHGGEIIVLINMKYQRQTARWTRLEARVVPTRCRVVTQAQIAVLS